ncbi:MAG: PEP-CTERM sorting domain-containing protein [Deltaproteobacteria bacterium]|nr:PEP-CTERM sorting domain-containing protein [Deltaproteobacteria bacterium]MBW2384849.1 PEP-CTERM sorting domain-containing protein [Deltaproteobacteria bacterium]
MTRMTIRQLLPLLAFTFAFVCLAMGSAQAFSRYNDGCPTCHGAFTDGTSPQETLFPNDNKHTMHRSNQYMATNCNLCHTADDENNPFIGSSDGTIDNPGLGCMGCHGRSADAGHDSISSGLGAGLRQHHNNSGVTACLGCHIDASPANYTPVGEDVFPTYYGTVDTAVDFPCNHVPTADQNENWSDDTDYIGLDNDGNLIYDAVDVTCVPEPSGTLLTLVGVTFLGAIGRRRAR